MRILNVVLSKQSGGLEQASLDYAAAFLRLGHQVSLVLSTQSPFLHVAEQVGCQVHCVASNYGHVDIPAMIALRRRIKREQPDIIFAHGNRAISLLRWAAMGLAPLVAVNHTLSVKRSVPVANVIVVNGELRKKLHALGHCHPSSVYVVPNMVDTKVVPVKDVQEHHSATPMIGALARFSPEKGLDVFLQALAILKKHGVPFKAKIGGDGNLRPDLEKLSVELDVADKVEFCGWIEDRDAFYRSLDVFCLPSRHETFGIVMLEALLRKIPVVTTNTTGPRELAEGHNVALFVPTEDANALADGMVRMFQNWEQTLRLAEAGHALVLEKYDIQIIAKQLQQIITQVTDSWKKSHGGK